MTRTSSTRIACTSIALASAFLIGVAAHANAADQEFDLPAGLACPGFDLHVEITNNPNRVIREFKDKNGKLVRMITAGRGNTLTFSNLATAKALALKSNGSVEHIAYNPDGSQKWMITGHNVLILFPTDVPAGPSTTLYVGRVVFTVDTNGVFTVQGSSGTSVDICAALSA